MNHEPFKNVAEGIQSITTSLALFGGGVWAYWRFVLNRESAHKVDLDADVTFVRKQGDNWVIEGVAWVKNPGNVRLDFKEFTMNSTMRCPPTTFRGKRPKEALQKRAT